LGIPIQFTSLEPFKVIVSGRIKHFISAFGEHVIVSEVEQALQKQLREKKMM
jgi:non-ribosomal peptide synthetase component E (peptide arylation enzyme)